MSSNKFWIKSGDTRPWLRAVLSDANGVVDLSTATVNFFMRSVKQPSTTVSGVATVVDGPAGVIEYEWVAGDTDVPGDYHAEFEVTFADATVATFPNTGYLEVLVMRELG